MSSRVSTVKSRMCGAAVVMLVAGIGSSVARADDFLIENITNVGTRVTSSCCGSWMPARGVYGEAPLISTAPGTAKPSWATTQTLQFQFTTQNYFAPSPQAGGHLAVFVRGDIYTSNPWNPGYPYRGHGVTIGDVSQYNGFFNPVAGMSCTAATGTATVAVEVAGSVNTSPVRDNCVFGAQTSAPITLFDNTTYFVSVSSSQSSPSSSNFTSYQIYRWDGVGWTLLYGTSIAYPYDFQTVGSQPLGGWFIAELGRGNLNWSVDIRNLVSSWQ